MRGEYAIQSGGADLADLTAHLLFPVGFHMFMRCADRYKENYEAREKLVDQLTGKQYEYDTGLPAIARFMPAADAGV